MRASERDRGCGVGLGCARCVSGPWDRSRDQGCVLMRWVQVYPTRNSYRKYIQLSVQGFSSTVVGQWMSGMGVVVCFFRVGGEW